MAKKNSDILKKINKKIDETAFDKELSAKLKAEIKELFENVSSDDLQEQIELINSKLEKLETNNTSLKDSVYDFVSSSSKTLEALAKTDKVSDDEQLASFTQGLKKIETKLDKFIKNNEENPVVTEVFGDDTQFKKLKNELTFFQNNLENRINENHEDLRDTLTTIISNLKEQVADVQEVYEKNSDKFIVEILSDIKQLKSDVSEVYDSIKVIDNQAIFETEKNVKKVLEQGQTSAENILTEIENVRKQTAKAASLEAKSKEAVEVFKNELTSLKNNLHTQIREVLSKILIQDEIKFLCEEAITGIKNNGSETSVLRKYLKELKNDDEHKFEILNEIKNIIVELSDYEMNESSDKIDIIYENMSMLNNWADSSDKMTHNFENLKDDFYKLEGHIDNFKEDFVLTADKIDVLYENLTFVNEWVKKLDEISKNIENIKAGYDAEADIPKKIEEITEQIALVKEWNKKADAIALQVKALSVQISETESTVNSQNLADMKKLFLQMTEDMSNMSTRTNKMILEADKTHEQMQEHLQNLKEIIYSFDKKTSENRIEELKLKIDDIKDISSKSVSFGQGLTESFLYLADWIDSAGNTINGIKNEIELLKENKLNNSYNFFDKEDLFLQIKNLLEESLSQKRFNTADNNSEIYKKLEQITEKLQEQDLKISKINEQLFSQLSEINESNNLIYNQNQEKNDTAFQQIAAQQALSQQILQDIKENRQEQAAPNTLSNENYNDIAQSLQMIIQMLQQNQNNAESQNLIKEEFEEDSLIFGSKNYSAEIKNLLDFVATQVVNISENNNKTDVIEKKIDALENKISNIEQYMARLIDYLDEE